jgi:DNA-directed RNA polymerase specialized sigma24 family protein
VRVDTSTQGEVERLYRDQRDRMWRAVFAFAGDPEVASDAVAEAFAQALRRGEAVRSPERWVWRTVFRVAAGELKEQGRRASEEIEGAYEMDEVDRIWSRRLPSWPRNSGPPSSCITPQGIRRGRSPTSSGRRPRASTSF